MAVTTVQPAVGTSTRVSASECSPATHVEYALSSLFPPTKMKSVQKRTTGTAIRIFWSPEVPTWQLGHGRLKLGSVYRYEAIDDVFVPINSLAPWRYSSIFKRIIFTQIILNSCEGTRYESFFWLRQQNLSNEKKISVPWRPQLSSEPILT